MSSRLLACIVIIVGILAVGMVDYATGESIHVVSLYFAPLAFASWRFGRRGAVLASLLCVTCWLGAVYASGSGDLSWYVWCVNSLTQGAAFLSVSMLVAALAEALRYEKSLGRLDPLTGLKNRRALVEEAGVDILYCRRHVRPVSLAYLDLDNFKQVNDLLGHAAGDDYLRKCGEAIRNSVRGSDIAVRLGGDEFVVFLPQTTPEQATISMERIRHAIESSVEFRAAGVTVSIGIVADATAHLDIDELLKRADTQMYRIKKSSKNRVHLCSLGDDVRALQGAVRI